MFILLLLAIMTLPAFADSEEFSLGKIDVVARRTELGEVANSQVGSSVTKDLIQNNNRYNVGDALDLLSGVTMSTNQRNEKTIAVRGFDSRQVPLFIDGIPVYVPFDGYVDFNRFTTADLASIQVAKGFSSVAYGPNTLGGAINLISRKPLRRLEADATVGAGSGDEWRAQSNLGTNQGKWYLQTGLSFIESDFFPLSAHFNKTPTENGGKRNNSYRKDSKLSVKVGLTPKQGDEYALSYYIQNGVKGQPPSTDPTKVRYWQWPYWNKQSLYFVSQTSLGDNELVKTRFYHDEFDNKINSYTDGSYTTLRTSGPGSLDTGKSIYHDYTNGGSLNIESYRLKNQTITLVGQFKSDTHREFNGDDQKNSFFRDNLFTLAGEDSVKLIDHLTWMVGFSHHELTPDKVYSRGNAYTLPHIQAANEWQTGLFHDYKKGSQAYVTVARKTRMPTLKDRYSQRLGTFIENPDLAPEKSVNLEVGHKGEFINHSKTEFALFYSDVRDKIQTMANVSGTKSQVQNIDKVRIYGTEIGISQLVYKKVEFGSNYTYTFIKNIKDNRTKITDIPRHKLIVNAIYRPSTKLSITPFLEYNSRRWASNTQEIPGFTVVNLKALYELNSWSSVDIGVTNLGDRNYSLAAGFPSPGRMFFANAYFKF